MKRLNIAVIGAGAVSELSHLPALQRLPEYNVIYVVDISERRLIQVAKKLRLDCKTVKDYKIALDDPKVDTVLIAVPPKFHKEMVVESANAQKNILCEKPFALNYKEAKEMVDVVIQNDVNLSVGYNFRFIGSFKKLKEMIDKNLFGERISLFSEFAANAYLWPSVSKFQVNEKAGGGALFEMGVHHVDLVTWFLGKPKVVWADIGKQRKKSPVDDFANVFLKFENKSIATLNVLWTNLSINKVSVFGWKGNAVADSKNREVLYHQKDLIAQPPIRMFARGEVHPFFDQLTDFYRFVRGKKSGIVTYNEILWSMKILDSAYEASKQNRFIELEWEE